MKKRFFVLKNWNVKMPSGMMLIATKVAICMAKSTHFPAPPVTLANFTTANTRLENAYANRSNGNAARIELQKAAADVDNMLRLLAGYVDDVAQGTDRAILEASGFTMSKGEISKATVPEMPDYLKVSSSNGSVNMMTRKPKGATSFCWAITAGTAMPDIQVDNGMLVIPAGANVNIIPVGRSREVIAGLKPGTAVTVQVLAQNAAGKSLFSAPATVYINK